MNKLLTEMASYIALTIIAFMLGFETAKLFALTVAERMPV
jgi:hypothetical protein